MIELDAAGVTVRSGDADRVLLHPTTCTLTERRVALIGANGSGKSTLARLVNGLRPVTSGRVRTLGLDVATHGPQVRARVGFVFTDPDAQLVMPTAVEDVALSLRASVRDARERDARARAVLARIGLAGHAETPVHALSGGQKQLLALAGVLATEPEILVCDEPTTLLDLRWRRVVDGLLDEVDAQVLLVTHDLDAAARADRVLVVDGGRVVVDGPPLDAVAEYRDRMAAP
ncbi:energy-coupling factor ABC transporter ATP-binding protein [Actinotalea sp. M2MS4P-6]|uniref:energy-coupling factor ABC transporter ATP-binding protein n=1 Tax=Actinotalea sp. M2MS4P-6 TaxID=2983762 RepID=UPI0021E4C745|nr:ABC transporter ATP-binding protein [Actinotalea sp. M2MS4P-6]MCV2393347.1 energy-coupling factor ABC transporter ATP-binding protein [Actinotalea sp. M2MS4P-6]